MEQGLLQSPFDVGPTRGNFAVYGSNHQGRDPERDAPTGIIESVE